LSFRSRMKRLERDRPNRGRCPLCRTRAGFVMKRFRQDSLDAAPVPKESKSGDSEPCTACGWSPEVVKIVEVIVNSREEVLRLREMEASSP